MHGLSPSEDLTRVPWKWDDIPDVLHASSEENQSLESKSESGVRDRSKTAKVEVPAVLLQRQTHLPDPSRQHVLALFALTPAN